MIRRISRAFVMLAALALLPAIARAQQSVLTGQVVERATQRPLADAQVLIVGTQRGTRSGEDGRFRIPNVAPGTYQIRAIRLGYETQVRSVTISEGASESLAFSLSPAAIKLDEVTVTAAGESQRRRESGVSTGSIDTSSYNLAAVTNLSSILSSRTPGVIVQQSGGTTGIGSRIRIRGSNSINLSNDPLLIVDGIRVNNSTNSFSIGVGGQTISRFDDVSAEDIENVEIIKGPAAAALYGTAAANGVIRVTTKRGRSGPTRFSTFAEAGSLREVTEYPANYAQIGALASGTSVICNLDSQAQRLCTPKPDSLLSFNPLEQVPLHIGGIRNKYGINVAGGGDVASYYMGGEFEREQGVLAINVLKRGSFRGNLRAQLRSNVDVSLTTSYLSSRLQLPLGDNAIGGFISLGILGKAFDCSPTTFRQQPLICGTDSLSRGYFLNNVPYQELELLRQKQSLEHFTGGLASNWQPLNWLRAVGQVGLDLVQRYDESLTPPGKIVNLGQATLEGSRANVRTQIPTYTANGSATATFQLRPSLQSETSLGGQYSREDFRSTLATGAVLLAGTESLNGASARFTVGETNQQVVTLGVFGRQQLAFRDRLFLTAAIRGDQGSTFGSQFGKIYYPSVNASWVISEEPFFPKTSLISQFRLRAGFGKSGQRPGFRQADSFFSPVSVNIANSEKSAITLGGTGNAQLKPELTTESEGGFEASFLDNHLGMELTFYSKSTRDALIAQRLAPSLGASLTRVTNLGKVTNKGVEALFNLNVLDTRSLKLESTITTSLNRNKLVNLGKDALGKDIPPSTFGFDNQQQLRNGYPIGAYFQRKIVSFQDINGDGIISRVNCPAYGGVANPQLVGGPRCEVVLSDSAEYLGSPIPSREATFNTNLTLFRNFVLSALFDYRGGVRQTNDSRNFRCAAFQLCRDIHDKTAPLADQASVMARLMGSGAGTVEDASFVKLRELSLTINAPKDLAGRFGTEGLSLTIAGRNLKTWTDYTGFDPEVNAFNGALFSTTDFNSSPPVRYFTARLNVSF